MVTQQPVTKQVKNEKITEYKKVSEIIFKVSDQVVLYVCKLCGELSSDYWL